MTKKFWHKLHVPDWETISKKTLEFVTEVKSLDILSRNGLILLDWKSYITHCPQVTTCLEHVNNSVLWAAIYVTRDSNFSKIHIDYDGEQHECRLNLPVLNCDGSVTEFFSGGEYKRMRQPNDLYFLYEAAGTAIKVDQVELNSPTILRVKSPHRVIQTEHRTPRISLSLYTKYDLVHFLD